MHKLWLCLFSGYFIPAFLFVNVRIIIKNSRRCCTIKELQINEEIREREVRLIGVDGEQLGVVSKNDALQKAFDENLDLVKVAANATPPVCRIMDYGKYKYEMAKKEKEARKNQRVINIKEVRLSPHIEEHDLKVKARQANQFLNDGDKVKVSVRFRGREMGHQQIGEKVLKDFAELTKEHGIVDQPAKMEGRNLVMFLIQKTE